MVYIRRIRPVLALIFETGGLAMQIRHIRQAVMELYPTATWHHRVSRMPDNQVYAIWKRSQEQPVKKKEPEKKEEVNHQITIWEYLNAKEVKDEETV